MSGPLFWALRDGDGLTVRILDAAALDIDTAALLLAREAVAASLGWSPDEMDDWATYSAVGPVLGAGGQLDWVYTFRRLPALAGDDDESAMVRAGAPEIDPAALAASGGFTLSGLARLLGLPARWRLERSWWRRALPALRDVVCWSLIGYGAVYALADLWRAFGGGR